MLEDQIPRILKLDVSDEEKMYRIIDLVKESIDRTETAVIMYDGDTDYAMEFLKDDLWGGYDDEE